jgi:hypothetical protein
MFSKEITEEDFQKGLKSAKEYNDSREKQYQEWKSHWRTLKRKDKDMSYYRGKPYLLDAISHMMTGGKTFSDKMLYKHRKIIFNSYFRLERLLWAQRVPTDLILSYKTRILKNPDVFSAFIYQLATFKREITDEFADIITTNWKYFKEYIDEENIELEDAKEIFNHPAILLLLRFEEGEESI